MVTYKFKRKKEQHEIKMASQDKRYKSERVNANTALYPTGFTCLVFSKVKPMKVYMILVFTILPSLRDSINSARVLYHFNSEKYGIPQNIQLFHKYLLRTSCQGLGRGGQGTRQDS